MFCSLKYPAPLPSFLLFSFQRMPCCGLEDFPYAFLQTSRTLDVGSRANSGEERGENNSTIVRCCALFLMVPLEGSKELPVGFFFFFVLFSFRLSRSTLLHSLSLSTSKLTAINKKNIKKELNASYRKLRRCLGDNKRAKEQNFRHRFWPAH